MKLLDLAREKGLNPKFAASTGGGEYHSACPSCAGTDRFVMQPNKQMKNCVGSYFCRQCGIHGDSIQFCLDFLEFTNFKDAVHHVGAEVPRKMPSFFVQKLKIYESATLNRPSAAWMQQAHIMVEEAHTTLLMQQDILETLCRRGLPVNAIQRYKIGWIPKHRTLVGKLWDLEKDIWCPAGLLVPTIDTDQCIIRLKIRRRDWHVDDTLAKYVAIPGSMSGLSIIGDKKHPIMIVIESEFDAYALHYAVGDSAVIIAVGGCTKNPDNVTHHYAQRVSMLLICHDNDAAGNHMFERWKKAYPHALAYPTPVGKDVGEAIQQGIDLRDWVLKGINRQ
jgi:DNA primase